MSDNPSGTFKITVLDIARDQLTLLTDLSNTVIPGDILMISSENGNDSAQAEVMSICRYDHNEMKPSVTGDYQQLTLTVLSGTPTLVMTSAQKNKQISDELSKKNKPLDLSLLDELGSGALDALGAKKDQANTELTVDLSAKSEQPEDLPTANPEEFIARPVEENPVEESIADRLSRVSQEMFGSAEETLKSMTQGSKEQEEASFSSYIGSTEEIENIIEEEITPLPLDEIENADPVVQVEGVETQLEVSESQVSQTESDDEDLFDFDINLDQKLTDGPILGNPIQQFEEVSPEQSEWDAPVPDDTIVISTSEAPPQDDLLYSPSLESEVLEVIETPELQHLPEPLHAELSEEEQQPINQSVQPEVATTESEPLENRPMEEAVKPKAVNPMEEIVDIVQPERASSQYIDSGFNPGDRIFTQDHGEGTIQKIFPFEDSYNITVIFDQSGRKILNTKYSEIEKR